MRYITNILSAILLLLGLRGQAQNAGENIDVSHYEIHINDVNFTARTIEGEALLTLTATANTSNITLELKALQVHTVNATGASVSGFTQNDDLLNIQLSAPLNAGQTATLDISYGGSTFNENWGGIHWWGNYVYNLGVGFESIPHNLGKTWFPCVDNFGDKATYDLFVTVENSKKAICGGNFMGSTDNGNGTTTWHWATPQEISTYHISMAIGDYELWEETYHGIERDIPVTVYAKPSQMDKVPGTFVHVKEIAAFFEACFGPYPFNRIGYVCTGQGCMEHTDNVAMASSIFTGNTTQEEYVAHEMSHMWFGNQVTCATAEEMWLNEGFGQFCGLFYRAAVYGEDAFQEKITGKTESITNWCNNPNNWIPLNQIPQSMTYDGNAVYDRGAVVVNSMMNYMGRETFCNAIKQHIAEHAYQAASTEDLLQSLTTASGMDMSHFFDTYVYHAGMPHYAIQISETQPAGSQYEASLQLTYKHIGSTYICPFNRIEVTFFDANGQHETQMVEFGADNMAQVTLGILPVVAFIDYYNHFLDGKTDLNQMITKTTNISFANLQAVVNSISDSTLLRFENHLIGPDNDPETPALSLSTQHYWTLYRHDFGETDIQAKFTYSKSVDNDIIITQNDSATLLYRANANEPWHEIAYTMHPQSTWKQGQFYVENFPSGDYCIAVWDKEQLSVNEALQGSHLQVYPNPTDGLVNLKWDGATSGQLILLDAQGRIAERHNFSNKNNISISVSHLAKGIYHLQLLDEGGMVLAAEKLIIQ